MGWFKIDTSGDVIGDDPLDRIGLALQKILTARNNETGSKPVLKDVLSELQFAIKKQPQNYFIDPDAAKDLAIKIKLLPGPLVITAENDHANNENEFSIWHEAFESIAVSYEETEMQRKPRINELLKTFKMVISYNPAEYFSDMEGKTIEELIT